MKFKVSEKVITPDGLAFIYSVQKDVKCKTKSGIIKYYNKYCVGMIPEVSGYTPSFFEWQMRTATDVNDILKEVL